MLKIAILISGRGSNMVSLINAITRENLACKIVCVIANKPAAGLSLAQAKGITTKLIDRGEFTSKQEHERAIQEELNLHQPDWIFLAGFMAILTSDFIQVFDGRIINIHPSLLPKFKGLNTHSRALEAAEIYHGVSIHLVTSKLDDGPIIAQSQIEILPDDTPETLQERVLEQEHILYPLVLKSLVEKNLEIRYSKICWHYVPADNSDKNISPNSILKFKNLD
ncbi:phosphoribosylglycinamide formyltransferase [Alphaproteobacteria bacterium]|nr:phosphoribosylglycinamide formyltransferase [Alphaproteobacteria bacterium]